jgi:hypothetical protein
LITLHNPLLALRIGHDDPRGPPGFYANPRSLGGPGRVFLVPFGPAGLESFPVDGLPVLLELEKLPILSRVADLAQDTVPIQCIQGFADGVGSQAATHT